MTGKAPQLGLEGSRSHETDEYQCIDATGAKFQVRRTTLASRLSKPGRRIDRRSLICRAGAVLWRQPFEKTLVRRLTGSPDTPYQPIELANSTGAAYLR